MEMDETENKKTTYTYHELWQHHNRLQIIMHVHEDTHKYTKLLL